MTDTSVPTHRDEWIEAAAVALHGTTAHRSLLPGLGVRSCSEYAESLWPLVAPLVAERDALRERVAGLESSLTAREKALNYLVNTRQVDRDTVNRAIDAALAASASTDGEGYVKYDRTPDGWVTTFHPAASAPDGKETT